MSPAQIHILLNHYALAEKTYESCGAGVSKKFYEVEVDEMKKLGLIDDQGKTTAFGNAYVDMLCLTPLPAKLYFDSRNQQLASALADILKDDDIKKPVNPAQALQ